MIWKYWDHLVSLINSNIRSDLEIFSYYHSIPICLSKLWDGFHSRMEYLPNQFIFQGYSVRFFQKIGQAKSNFLFYFLFHFLSQLGNMFGCLSVCLFVSANPLSKANKKRWIAWGRTIDTNIILLYTYKKCKYTGVRSTNTSQDQPKFNNGSQDQSRSTNFNQYR